MAPTCQLCGRKVQKRDNGLCLPCEGLNNIKKIQSQMKDTLSEIKNNLQGNNSRMNKAKYQISDLEYKETKKQQIRTIILRRKSKKPQGQCKQPLGQLQAFQHSLHRDARRKRERVRNWKENFLNLVKETDMQVQEAQRVPNKMDAKRPTPRHIIIEMPKAKDKERILKVAREKKLFT